MKFSVTVNGPTLLFTVSTPFKSVTTTGTPVTKNASPGSALITLYTAFVSEIFINSNTNSLPDVT